MPAAKTDAAQELESCSPAAAEAQRHESSDCGLLRERARWGRALAKYSFQTRRATSWPPRSNALKLMPSIWSSSDVGNCVGACDPSRASFSMCMSVVLPALSSPCSHACRCVSDAQMCVAPRGWERSALEPLARRVLIEQRRAAMRAVCSGITTGKGGRRARVPGVAPETRSWPLCCTSPMHSARRKTCTVHGGDMDSPAARSVHAQSRMLTCASVHHDSVHSTRLWRGSADPSVN